MTRLSRCGKAMGFHRRASQTLKTAVLAKPGDLRSMRSP
jgi:hypothetical protein